MSKNINLICTLTIYKNGEKVNEFTYTDGRAAYELAGALAVKITGGVQRCTIKRELKNGADILLITTIFNTWGVDGDAVGCAQYKYIRTFTGSDIYRISSKF